MGDIVNNTEQKQASKIPVHVSIVTANILSLLQGKKAAAMYRGQYEMIAIVNGKVCFVILSGHSVPKHYTGRGGYVS